MGGIKEEHFQLLEKGINRERPNGGEDITFYTLFLGVLRKEEKKNQSG